MVFVNICGSTFSNTSFSVASAFLSSEDTESIKWVLANCYKKCSTKPLTNHQWHLLQVEILNWLQQLGQWSLHPNSSCLLCIRHVCEDLFVHGERVLRAEALNMRLTEYVNTKWEEMIRDWRAVMYAKTEHDYAVAWSNFKPGNQGSFVNISMNHDIWLSRHKSSSVAISTPLRMSGR
jgi:hypothetical protein